MTSSASSLSSSFEELSYNDTLNIGTLKVHQLIDTLHISATFTKSSDADSFLAPHEQSIRDARKKNEETGEVTCFRTFSFSPTSKFALFDSAKIDNLEMSEKFPVALTDENLQHLRNLLDGCTIKKISVVFEEKTLHNLVQVPALAADLGSTHVNFHLVHIQNTLLFDPVLDGEFASELVAAAVKEVSFSGNGVDGHGPRRYQPSWSLDLLLNLFDAGIERVTVNTGALMVNAINMKTMHEFVPKLANLGRPLQLNTWMCGNELWRDGFQMMTGSRSSKV